MEHISVMPNEVIEYLNIWENGIYIDCTFGSGGHSRDILNRLSQDGRLISIDWDENAVEKNGPGFGSFGNFKLIRDNFANLRNIAGDLKLGRIDGILFDLGFSSTQVDDKERGFSFLSNAPLDMRYSASNPLTAQILLNNYPKEYLENILDSYAQERFSRSIVAGILRYRSGKPIETTQEVVEIIKKSTPVWYHHRRIHCATKTFQAIRMAVNAEVENIEKGLKAAIDLVSSKGRVVVISFHSVEHRMVKTIFREAKQNKTANLIVKKSVLPSENESNSNPRARSAQLRAIEKL